MRHSISWLLLTSLFSPNWNAGVLAQTSSASWIYPLVDDTTINYIDTIYLQWTSNYQSAFLHMWCQANDSIGNDVVLGSAFSVEPSGEYGYVISRDDPSQTTFPVACHANLAYATDGSGVDDPVGVTFTSQNNVAAQTFSLITTTAVTSTPVTSKSLTSAITASTSSTGSTSGTGGTTSSPSIISQPPPTTNTRSQSAAATLSTFIVASTSTPAASSNNSTIPHSNNLGAIVGGSIGGTALVVFFVLGILFIRKYQRRPDDSTNRNSKSWWRPTYRTTEMQTGGLHEKAGDSIVRYETDGRAIHEKEGSGPMSLEKEAVVPKRKTVFELPT